MEEIVIVTEAEGWPLELCRCPMISIYEHPSDFPDNYVARLFDIGAPTAYIAVASALEDLRRIMPDNLICLPRFPDDDPVIVECWI